MTTDWDVGKLMGISGGYWSGCALQAGVRLKVFNHLGGAGCRSQDVAGICGSDGRATGLLLDAFSAMGLLIKTGNIYANTDFSAKFLVESSPAYLGYIILHHHHILDGWAQLDQAVTTGKKVERRGYGAEIERQSFLMGMFNIASGLAPQLASNLNLEGRKKLLDLGGGPGTYAIHFCLENPELNAVIYDRPTTEPFARKTVESYKLSERIDFIGGDFNEDAILGGPYDVAWMSHILHSNSYEQCGVFIAKAAAALESGGLLIIHDFILNDNKDGPEFPALFALNMLVGTDNGRSYSRKEIVVLLEKCNFQNIEHRKLQVTNDSSVITGVKV